MPKDPTRMPGFGSHTHSFWNAAGERVWVRFHFKTRQGIANHTKAEGAAIIGAMRESCREALSGAIERGGFPRWSVHVQVMPELEAGTAPFGPTKVWPKGDHPRIEAGEIELNRNAGNDFARIGQAAFPPSDKVPGIGHSPDRMLQARVFSHADAHRDRLGTHCEPLPVNAPHVPVHHSRKDGQMNLHGQATGAGEACYEPNSFGGAAQDPGAAGPPLRLSGDAGRWDRRAGNDDCAQPARCMR